MMPRSPKVLVLAAACLSAGAVVVAAAVLEGPSASTGFGPSATATIAQAPPESVAVILPPETDRPVILAATEPELAGEIHPGALFATGAATGLANTFALRPALSERDLPTRFEAAAQPRDAAPAASDEDLPVIVVSRHVSELPPRRPADLASQDVATADVAILDILPPARPAGSRLKFASLDPAAAAVTDETLGSSAAATGQASAPSQGLFGILGRLGHPGAGLGTVLPPTGPVQTGLASWYGPGFHGRRTASGERFDQNELTAAHRTLPFGTRVRVIDEETGRSVIVRINDRGPFKRGRIIDLSRGSALALGVASMRRVKVVSADE